MNKSRITALIGGAYLVGIIPANYITAAIDNNLDFSNFGAVVDTVFDADASTILAGGLPRLTDENPTTFESTEAHGENFYTVTGQANITYDPAPGEYVYFDTDMLGRTQGAYAFITPADRAQAQAEGRDSSELPDPSGWPDSNGEVDVNLPTGDTYHGWFWNRSHLIADSLGGSTDIENLVTGTRMQNVGDNTGNGGMAYTETKVRDFLDDPANTDCGVYYATEANYQGDELIPRTVTVDVRTCDGTIDENVIVDNIMPGYAINYHTGEWTKEN